MKTKTRKTGFTLAEIIIALGIVGVIMAVSIPVITMTTDKKTYVMGLKKAYLILKTATGQLMIDNGGTMLNLTTSNGSNLWMNKYCTKLNCIKKCNVGVNGCFHTQTSAKTLNGANLWYNPQSYATAILSNGMLVLFDGLNSKDCVGTGGYCGSINIDINGFKKPNRCGRDIFNFFVFKDKGLIPLGSKDDPWYTSTSWNIECNPSSSNTYNGGQCSGMVLIEGNMTY